jgi:hypothetical protein
MGFYRIHRGRSRKSCPANEFTHLSPGQRFATSDGYGVAKVATSLPAPPSCHISNIHNRKIRRLASPSASSRNLVRARSRRRFGVCSSSCRGRPRLLGEPNPPPEGRRRASSRPSRRSYPSGVEAARRGRRPARESRRRSSILLDWASGNDSITSTLSGSIVSGSTSLAAC